MKNKNAVELTLNVIVVAAIVLIVLVVSIMIYTGVIGKEKTELDKHIFSMMLFQQFANFFLCVFAKHKLSRAVKMKIVHKITFLILQNIISYNLGRYRKDACSKQKINVIIN